MSKNSLFVEFANERGTFPIVLGSTMTDCYNETLDSASIIISKLPKKLEIKPNEEVRIFDNNGNQAFTRYYLIDNIYCKEITLNNNKEFQYTIELKSLTGYLDLIQLPNRTLNHSLVSGQKMIIDYIEEFMYLYVPKIKMTLDGTTWNYTPLIEVDDSNEFIEKFSVPCRDLTFTQPTLRQVLTTLMLQVGCLPKVEKVGSANILSFLDLRAKPTQFFVEDNSTNYTSYSMAGDSYVNTLVNMNDNVLDDENVVLTETIGFRDVDNIFLKQKENLFLNTNFPIYSVEKLIMKIPTRIISKVRQENPFTYNGSPVGLGFTIDTTNNTIVGGSADFFAAYNRVVFSADTYFYCYSVAEDVGTGDITYTFLEKIPLSSREFSQTNNVMAYTTHIAANIVYILVGSATATAYNQEDSFTDKNLVLFDREGIALDFGTYYCFVSRDITKNCVEVGKRNLLDTNFLEMAQSPTLEEVAKYVYGTVSYEIGSKKIVGFSQTYDYAVGWWTEQATYIENIIGVAFRGTENYIDQHRAEFNEKYWGGLPNFVDVYSSNLEFVKYDENQVFTSLLFDLTYKPLNTFRLNNIKDEHIDFKLEQLDTKDNSIANFNDLLEVEKQKVNRLGNEVIVKNQRTRYLSTINPVNSKIGDYIVFERTIGVGLEDFKVNYTASKNYVLQNYFTAIQTKYRAYEYTNYDQNVVRKENTTVFARIGRDYYDGDDYIYFGAKESGATNRHLEYVFLSGAINIFDTSYQYKCGGSGDNYGLRVYRTDLSIMIGENLFAFNTQDFDHVSYGIQIDTDSEYNGNVGGLPQHWVIKGEESGFDYFSYMIMNGTNEHTNEVHNDRNELKSIIRESYGLPLINNPNMQNVLSLVDNNKTSYYTKLYKTYSLDKQELLNQTIQFDFYTDDDGILWTEKLWKLCWFVYQEKPKGKKYYYLPSDDEEFGINKTSYTTIDTSKLQEMTFDSYETKFENGALVIRWADIRNGLKWLKIIYEENGVYYDLLALKNTNNLNKESFYITLNDTKTDRVACLKFNEILNDFRGIIAFNEYVVEKNTLNRSILKV